MSQSVRIAMAHLRKLAQQPGRFEQRTRGTSKEEKHTLQGLVAMYKKPEDSFVDSFESEDLQTPSRRLRKVDTDELDLEALCDDLDEWSCKKKKRKTMASKGGAQEHVQTTLMASMLTEVLSADPVSPALKSGIKKKPTSPMFKKPSKAKQEDTTRTEEEEEEEEETEKEEEVTKEEKYEEEQE